MFRDSLNSLAASVAILFGLGSLVTILTIGAASAIGTG